MAGEKTHEIPQKKCLLMPPEMECKKAPWQRVNHLGEIEVITFSDLFSFQIIQIEVSVN